MNRATVCWLLSDCISGKIASTVGYTACKGELVIWMASVAMFTVVKLPQRNTHLSFQREMG